MQTHRAIISQLLYDIKHPILAKRAQEAGIEELRGYHDLLRLKGDEYPYMYIHQQLDRLTFTEVMHP